MTRDEALKVAGELLEALTAVDRSGGRLVSPATEWHVGIVNSLIAYAAEMRQGPESFDEQDGGQAYPPCSHCRNGTVVAGKQCIGCGRLPNLGPHYPGWELKYRPEQFGQPLAQPGS